jgi:transcriptional regulator GlxA family with amidase domain
MITMPPEEPHETASVLTGRRSSSSSRMTCRGEASCSSNTDAVLVATRIRRELALPDAFTPLAVEGLALELTAIAGRSRAPAPADRWAEQAHSLLRERFREAVTPREIAREIGVHPAHLARVFRTRYGESLGEHIRRLLFSGPRSR